MTTGKHIPLRLLRLAFCASLLVFLVGFPAGPNHLAAQTGTRTNTNKADSLFRGDSAAVTGIQYHKDIPDSILREKVFFFHYRTLTTKIDQLDNPTLSPTGIQFCDPLDALNDQYYLGKGVVGHPHTALFPTLSDGIDMQLLPDPNIGYAKRPGNIRFYQTQTPYTVLSYNSSLNKDYVVKLLHTQNIRPGWNFSINYDLIRPDGVYTSSGAKNHYLDATMNYFSRDSRLQGRGGIIWQAFNIDENGGISDDSYFTQRTLSNRAGVPVNLYNCGTRHRELTAFGSASYSMVPQFEHYRHRDSITARTVDDSLVVFDTVALVDTIPLRKPSVFNLGVLGVDVRYDRRKRAFADSTYWREQTFSVYWTNDAYPDHRWRNPLKLTAGIQPRAVFAAIRNDTLKLWSWIDPFARAEVRFGPLTFTGSADLRGTFGATGRPDSRFVANLLYDFDTTRHTQFDLEAVKQTRTLDLLPLHDFYLATGFTSGPIESERYTAHFHHRDMVDILLRANHLSHNVWYDSMLVVHQGTTDLWLYQARLTLKLNWRWLHLDMQHFLQYSSDTIQMPLPRWACKNSLYVDIPLFSRAMRMQIGADLRHHTPYYAPGYEPTLGVFYHQDQERVGGYIWADMFINIQIKRASFYLKGGHLNALWDSSPDYFLLPHYPGQKFGLFWGITWKFFD